MGLDGVVPSSLLDALAEEFPEPVNSREHLSL